VRQRKEREERAKLRLKMLNRRMETQKFSSLFFNLGFPPSPSSSLSAFSPSLVDSTQKCHIQLKFYVLEENEPLARCSLLIFISSSRAPKASLLAQSSALLFYAFTPEGRRERRETKEPKAESNQIRVDKHFHVHWKNYN
jgi:hypothetical protein